MVNSYLPKNDLLACLTSLITDALSAVCSLLFCRRVRKIAKSDY